MNFNKQKNKCHTCTAPTWIQIRKNNYTQKMSGILKWVSNETNIFKTQYYFLKSKKLPRGWAALVEVCTLGVVFV